MGHNVASVCLGLVDEPVSLYADAAGLSPKSRDKRQSLIARTKSEAALPGAARSALYGERPEAALQLILDYLSSEAFRLADWSVFLTNKVWSAELPSTRQ